MLVFAVKKIAKTIG